MTHFHKGSKVQMTNNALENYGEQYRGVTFTVSIVSKSEKDHPGYDKGVAPDWLYDLKTPDGADFPCSLYDYELKQGF
jgi:hypothetical protein